jgi:N-methylhydantoinase A
MRAKPALWPTGGKVSENQQYRLGVDVGGTFTDFVLLDENNSEIHIAKSLTTPADPSVGILTGVKAFDERCAGHVEATCRIAHATTLVANSVIERKGAVTALLTTKGFRDILELRRHVRVTTYELFADPPEPLVPRWLRLPVDERVFSDGNILKAVQREDVERAVDAMRAEGVTSLAIAFLHSYVNPANEQAAAEIVRELAPEIAVTLSSDVLPQIKEFERTSTTVVNAYVKPLAQRYLANLDAGLQSAGYKAPLHIMLSNGGLGSTMTAGDFPIRLIESGPVAGAIVGRQLAELMNIRNVLSFDMGGTTAKACLIRDQALPITDELEVARSKRFTKSSGFPVGVPAVNMIEIGAGGGSIAGVNQMGIVQVGPESAGADPGPICYRQGGTRPTVTDADLTLGYLNPSNFAGGTMTLDDARARAGLDRDIGAPQSRTTLQAAWTVHDVINETMAAAVRMHVTERGGNPEEATMVAFGGAGPVHSYNLARKLHIQKLVVPLRAGVLSALGLLVAPPAYDMVKTYKAPIRTLDAADITAQMDAMASEISILLNNIEEVGERRFRRALDVGYIGQSYQVTVPLEGAPEGEKVFDTFARLYREKYGYFYEDVPAEIVNLRVLGEITGAGLDLTPMESGDGSAAMPTGERPAYSASRGEMLPFAVFDRATLRPGMKFLGPAIVEEVTSTTIVDIGASVEIDAYGSLVIDLP